MILSARGSWVSSTCAPRCGPEEKRGPKAQSKAGPRLRESSPAQRSAEEAGVNREGFLQEGELELGWPAGGTVVKSTGAVDLIFQPPALRLWACPLDLGNEDADGVYTLSSQQPGPPATTHGCCVFPPLFVMTGWNESFPRPLTAGPLCSVCRWFSAFGTQCKPHGR